MTDARNGTTTFAFNAADQVVTNTTPSPDGVQSGLVTVNFYNNMGQVWKTIQPDGGIVTNDYKLTGELSVTYGSRTYPVEYTFDYAGRMKTMKTWQNYAGNSGTATTTWNYDSQRGFLTSKRYDDNQGPTYTYTSAGRLATRVWQRSVTTTYGYDYGGSLLSTVYSDGTTGVTNTVNRLGRVTQIASSSTIARDYNDAGLLLAERYTSGPLNGLGLTNRYDQYLRRTNLTLNAQPSTLNHAWSFDSGGRMSEAWEGTNKATYSYLANSPLVDHITFQNNGTTRMVSTRQFDYLNRLTNSISTTNSVNFVRHLYNYNTASQRTKNTREDGSYWLYSFDQLGQVTGGKKYWSDGSVVAGQQFEYTFDDIGNRISTRAGGDQYAGNLRAASYSANSLNQYASRTVPSYLDVMGSAVSNATVTLNLQSTYRKGEYFRKESGVDNSTAPVWQAITNIAVRPNGASPDYVTTNTGNMLLAKASETFLNDADGNLISDSLWTNRWNGENRRTNIESQASVATTGKIREGWSYLSDGRWVQRIVSTNNGSGWVNASTNRYVWDGQVLLAVLDHTNGVVTSFLRGLDLSGTPQGAGGVGGVLAITQRATTPSTAFYAFDGNGNVSALLSAANGSEAARYDYDPFGQTIRADGTLAKVNLIRFSTQYSDDIAGDLKYLYRDYRADVGRWISRDPSAEEGGENLFGTLDNDSLNKSEYLGLWEVKRQHLPRAMVVAEKANESVQDLAMKVGLDASEYQRWLIPTKKYSNFGNRLALQSELCKGDTFTIPNQVIIIVGKTSFWPKPRRSVEAMANFGANQLYGKGFSVVYKNREVQTFGAFDVTSYVGKDLFGFAFFGHGTTALWPFNDPNIGGDFLITKGEQISPQDMRQISLQRFRYGMAITYLCSAPFADWQSLVSPNGTYWGTGGFYQWNGADSNAVKDAFRKASDQ